MEYQKDINEIKLQVGLLEKDIKLADRQCERTSVAMKENIEKLQEVNLTMVKMITIHEQKHEQHEKAEIVMKDEVKELHTRITAVNREMQERMVHVENNISEKIDSLRTDILNHANSEKPVEKKKFTDFIAEFDRWKWMVVGGGLVLGWVFGNIGIVHRIIEFFTSK